MGSLGKPSRRADYYIRGLHGYYRGLATAATMLSIKEAPSWSLQSSLPHQGLLQR
jgi:hypothetical protein